MHCFPWILLGHSVIDLLLKSYGVGYLQPCSPHFQSYALLDLFCKVISICSFILVRTCRYLYRHWQYRHIGYWQTFSVPIFEYRHFGPFSVNMNLNMKYRHIGNHQYQRIGKNSISARPFILAKESGVLYFDQQESKTPAGVKSWKYIRSFSTDSWEILYPVVLDLKIASDFYFIRFFRCKNMSKLQVNPCIIRRINIFQGFAYVFIVNYRAWITVRKVLVYTLYVIHG